MRFPPLFRWQDAGAERMTAPRALPGRFLRFLRRLSPSLHAFARDVRGTAGVELAIGAVALVSVSAVCFDLYSRVKADVACRRMAAVMADYVSRELAPDGDRMEALSAFLYRHDLGVPAALVFVVTAIHQPSVPDTLPEVLWTDDQLRMGDPARAAELAAGCARHVDAGGRPILPDGFEMAADETLVVIEVCARLAREGSLTGRFVGGEIYRVHAMPFREPRRLPAAPAYAEPSRRLGVDLASSRGRTPAAST